MFKQGLRWPRLTPVSPATVVDAVIGAEVARKMAPPGQWLEPSAFLCNAWGHSLPCPDVIDVTGRARFLVFGPYLTLSPGRWRATVFLHLCPDAARRPLAVQFGAEPDYTSVDLPFGVRGNHRVDIEHTLGDGDAVQVRLWLKKAAFHGEARLVGVCLALAETAAAVGGDHV